LNTGLPASGSPLSGSRSVSVQREEGEEEGEERVPPLQKIEIKLESETEDWASVIDTVLSSADKDKGETGKAPPTPDAEEKMQEEAPKVEEAEPKAKLPPGEVNKLQPELQFDLNIDKALDLGFNPVGDGGTLFTLAAITDSDNSNLTIRRTTTISTHSQYSTPSEGPSDERSPAILAPMSMTHAQVAKPFTSHAFSDIRSTSSTKGDVRVGMRRSPKFDEGLPWWKKALGRLKRVQGLLRPHRSTC
jgi:hypothetical protein